MRLSELRQIASEEGGPAELRFALFNWKFQRPSYEEWASSVEASIKYVMTQMAKRKGDLQGLGEDQLTATVTTALTCFGVDARSARINGNCDVTIEQDADYVWIGEAKLYTGITHVWGGYQQLVTRYATGLPHHCRGGMLLYCYKGSADVLLAEWRATLQEQLKSTQFRQSPDALSFVSEEPSQATGLPLVVTHFAFPLFHQPMEKVAKLTKAARDAGRKVKRAAKIEDGR